MLLTQYAARRLQAVLDETRRLQECEFPYPQSLDALHQLERLFEDWLRGLRSLDEGSDPKTVRQICARTLDYSLLYLPILGFILRSTNVRNAFEVYWPLLELAGEVLEPEVPRPKRRTRVILSSEWDHSPRVYSHISELPGFVLIGLPAPESSNPLLVPLAGHELGHALWLTRHCRAAFEPIVKGLVLDLVRSRWDEYQRVFPGLQLQPEELEEKVLFYWTYAKAVEWALAHATESFCDFVAVRLFGLPYLYASAYLLAPRSSGRRALAYPNMKRRAANLVAAARAYGMNPPADYEELFEDRDEVTLPEGDKLQFGIADAVLPTVVDRLIARAAELVPEHAAADPSQEEARRILEHFRNVVPAEDVRSLASIIHAGWLAFHDTRFWDSIPHVAEAGGAVLRELVLKNIEILEREQILREKHPC